MHGSVIGIHSRIGLAITDNIHVPVDTYRETWDRLVKGEAWGGGLFGIGGRTDAGRRPAYLGVVFDPETADLKIDRGGQGLAGGEGRPEGRRRDHQGRRQEDREARRPAVAT